MCSVAPRFQVVGLRFKLGQAGSQAACKPLHRLSDCGWGMWRGTRGDTSLIQRSW